MKFFLQSLSLEVVPPKSLNTLQGCEAFLTGSEGKKVLITSSFHNKRFTLHHPKLLKLHRPLTLDLSTASCISNRAQLHDFDIQFGVLESLSIIAPLNLGLEKLPKQVTEVTGYTHVAKLILVNNLCASCKKRYRPTQ